MRKYLVVRDAETIIADLRERILRKASPALAPRAAKVRTAGAAADPEYDEPISTPILKQVNRAKQRAETDAIMAALHSTRRSRKQVAQILNIDTKHFFIR